VGFAANQTVLELDQWVTGNGGGWKVAKKVLETVMT
jgi:hypothetical protein